MGKLLDPDSLEERMLSDIAFISVFLPMTISHKQLSMVRFEICKSKFVCFFYLAGKFENTLSYTVLREQPANCLSTHQAHPAIQTRLYAMQGEKINSVIPTRVLHKLNQRYRHVFLNPQQIK